MTRFLFRCLIFGIFFLLFAIFEAEAQVLKNDSKSSLLSTPQHLSIQK